MSPIAGLLLLSMSASHIRLFSGGVRPASASIALIPRGSPASAHLGPCGQLEGMKEALLTWIFERREMGFAVLTYSVLIKACAILPLMEQKSAIVLGDVQLF